VAAAGASGAAVPSGSGFAALEAAEAPEEEEEEERAIEEQEREMQQEEEDAGLLTNAAAARTPAIPPTPALFHASAAPSVPSAPALRPTASSIIHGIWHETTGSRECPGCTLSDFRNSLMHGAFAEQALEVLPHRGRTACFVRPGCEGEFTTRAQAYIEGVCVGVIFNQEGRSMNLRVTPLELFLLALPQIMVQVW
jgi:hypothetical protein